MSIVDLYIELYRLGYKRGNNTYLDNIHRYAANFTKSGRVVSVNVVDDLVGFPEGVFTYEEAVNILTAMEVNE